MSDNEINDSGCAALAFVALGILSLIGAALERTCAPRTKFEMIAESSKHSSFPFTIEREGTSLETMGTDARVIRIGSGDNIVISSRRIDTKDKVRLRLVLRLKQRDLGNMPATAHAHCEFVCSHSIGARFPSRSDLSLPPRSEGWGKAECQVEVLAGCEGGIIHLRFAGDGLQEFLLDDVRIYGASTLE